MHMCAKLLQSFLTLSHCDPLDCSLPNPLPMGFSRQEYWSGLPWPPPGNLPHPGIKPTSLIFLALADGLFTSSAPGKPIVLYS